MATEVVVVHGSETNDVYTEALSSSAELGRLLSLYEVKMTLRPLHHANSCVNFVINEEMEFGSNKNEDIRKKNIIHIVHAHSVNAR